MAIPNYIAPGNGIRQSLAISGISGTVPTIRVVRPIAKPDDGKNLLLYYGSNFLYEGTILKYTPPPE